MKISIVTPSFQQGRFIERTIRSVLHQNIAEMEYVVVDGGSTDETVSILKQYSNHLRYVSESDRGQAHAVNKGLAMTSGDIIGWLNSDDVYYDHTLKKVLDIFARYPDVGVVYGDAYIIDQDDQVINQYPTEAWNIERLKQTCYLSQPAVFFRREVVIKHGMLDESLNFCMDYEYWLRLALHDVKFFHLQDILSGSRSYAETKTLSFPTKTVGEAVRMLRKKLGYVPRRWLINDAAARVRQKTKLRSGTFLFKCATAAVLAAGWVRRKLSYNL